MTAPMTPHEPFISFDQVLPAVEVVDKFLSQSLHANLMAPEDFRRIQRQRRKMRKTCYRWVDTEAVVRWCLDEEEADDEDQDHPGRRRASRHVSRLGLQRQPCAPAGYA